MARKRIMGTKEKRAQAVKRLTEIAERFGCSVEAHNIGMASDVTISHRDARVMIGLNWVSGNDFLAHWNANTPHRFRPDFTPLVNPYHFAKATSYAGDFDTICALVQHGLRRIEQSTAFVEE